MSLHVAKVNLNFQNSDHKLNICFVCTAFARAFRAHMLLVPPLQGSVDIRGADSKTFLVQPNIVETFVPYSFFSQLGTV